ncbi:MAG: hypothetical protein ACP5M9_04390 [Candidatus Micrarchaeia archaeon]
MEKEEFEKKFKELQDRYIREIYVHFKNGFIIANKYKLLRFRYKKGYYVELYQNNRHVGNVDLRRIRLVASW